MIPILTPEQRERLQSDLSEARRSVRHVAYVRTDDLAALLAHDAAVSEGYAALRGLLIQAQKAIDEALDDDARWSEPMLDRDVCQAMQAAREESAACLAKYPSLTPSPAPKGR